MSENNINIVENVETIEVKKRGRPRKPESEKINIKEYMKVYNKKYYEEHKPEPVNHNLPKTMQCPNCSITVNTYNIKVHQKTKKCLIFSCLKQHGLVENAIII